MKFMMSDFTVTVTPEIIGDSTVKVIGAQLARDAFKKKAEATANRGDSARQHFSSQRRQ